MHIGFLEEFASPVRKELEADIVLYLGPIERPYDDLLISLCEAEKRRKNVLLCIVTLGGNPHAAYRMARTLQHHYLRKQDSSDGGEFYAFVPSVCASAGTLLIMGATKLYLSPHSELGPIDVQLRRHDEVGESTSGLTPVQALEYLRHEGVRLFEEHFLAMRFGGDLSFPTSMASKVAAEITYGCLGKLYEQIDPLRVAEINRTLSIAEHYGEKIGKNLKKGALQRLLRDYPSHDTVIDGNEAEEIFEKILPVPEALRNLGERIKKIATNLLSKSEGFVTYLTENEHSSASNGNDDPIDADESKTLSSSSEKSP